MCGIAGIVGTGSRRHRDRVGRMVAALRHRGPDGHGILEFDDCVLGHARLSIVDLRTGDQPMPSADGSAAVAFNGEIYGYREIRSELSARHTFRTTSDTEVILALYERCGAEMMPRLPGMFAFALWDNSTRSLFCARDRFGEKPLYYARGLGGEFVFASEIKALLASGLIEPEVDPDAVVRYLRDACVGPRRTIYRNVQQLPPAHQLVLEDGRLRVTPYWSLPAGRNDLNLEEAAEEFGRLFRRAVERQLVADVPVGAFLSGGLDSTSIVACAAAAHPGIQTFSFGFGEAINELPYAAEAARLYGTDHSVLTQEDVDIAGLLREMPSVYDEPFGDSSNIPTYVISRLARQRVKVVLTGDGGDELLAGYSYWYPAVREAQEAVERSSQARRAVRALRRKAVEAGAPARWLRYGGVVGLHLNRRRTFSDAELVRLGLRPTEESDPAWHDDALDALLRHDVLDYMPGDILVKTDRASMAYGLELRAPFLDVDLASFCISLPVNLKIDGGRDKVVLRKAMSGRWPESIRTRGKQGFGAPVERWLKMPDVAALKRECLGNPRSKVFERLSFEGTREFATRDNQQTWVLLALALWFEREGSARGEQ